MIPGNWTSESGKFSPKQSDYGFDARSNMAINVQLRDAVRNNQVSSDEGSLSNGSEDTHGNTSNDTHGAQTKKKKKDKDKNTLLEEEIEDPVERHQFYKKLKKAGIKKTFEFDDDWETSSVNSEVSEISLGNASYILDLAQQKESRKKDREEEALEEALELYGTWLTEGKNDDKNIFLMILHEVKKEQKGKYKKADKRHAALLDAALDDELKRREQVKQEELERAAEEAIQKEGAEKKVAELETVPELEAETIIVSPSGRSRKKYSGSTHSRTGLPSSNNSISNLSGTNRSTSSRKSFHRKQSESKISEIIVKQKSFGSGDSEDPNYEADEADGGETHDSLDSGDLSPFESLDISCDNEEDNGQMKPSSRLSRTSTHSRNSVTSQGSRRRLFHMGSKANVTKPPLSKDAQKSSGRGMHDSKGLFGRLRRTLSERQVQQAKEQEISWKNYSTALTAEERWWKKINDAKRDTILFEQSKGVLDTTLNTVPSSGMSNMDFSTRTDPGNRSRVSVDGNPNNFAPDEKPNPVTVKKPKSIIDLDVVNGSKELTPEKKKKKKHERRDSAADGGSAMDSLSEVKKSKHERKGETIVPELNLDDLKSPKQKDKKKKKKSKSKSIDRNQEYMQGSMVLNDVEKTKKKKKEKASKSLDSIDESDNQSLGARSKSGKKKKSRSSFDESPRRKAKTKSTVKSDTSSANLGKKRKKKKPQSSLGSSSDDAIYGDEETKSVDWTNRCIHPAQSEESGAVTVMTIES